MSEPNIATIELCTRCGEYPTIVELDGKYFARPRRFSKCKNYPKNRNDICRTEICATPSTAASAWEVLTGYKSSSPRGELEAAKVEDDAEFIPSGDSVSDACIVKLTRAYGEACDRIAELEAQLAEANYRVTVHSDIAAENNLLRCRAETKCEQLQNTVHALHDRYGLHEEERWALLPEGVDVADHLITLTTRAESAEAERDRLKERVAHWQEEHRDMVGRWQQMTEERNGLRAALEQVEYHQAYTLACPWCFRLQEYGHKPDCIRQAALRADAQEGK